MTLPRLLSIRKTVRVCFLRGAMVRTTPVAVQCRGCYGVVGTQSGCLVVWLAHPRLNAPAPTPACPTHFAAGWRLRRVSVCLPLAPHGTAAMMSVSLVCGDVQARALPRLPPPPLQPPLLLLLCLAVMSVAAAQQCALNAQKLRCDACRGSSAVNVRAAAARCPAQAPCSVAAPR